MRTRLDLTLTVPSYIVLNQEANLQSNTSTTQSNSTSSLSRLNAKAAEGGFCDWIKQLSLKICRFFGLSFGAPHNTRRVLTAQELQERIQKGRDFINNNIDHHLGNSARNLSRDKFLVVMSYNNTTVAAFPTNHPIDLNRLKRDAIAKFETMMQQPSNRECLEDNNLIVDTYYFARQIRSSDRALSPFIVCENKRYYRCFGKSDTGDHFPSANGGIWRVYDNEFNAWLNEKIPASTPERQETVTYALGALSW